MSPESLKVNLLGESRNMLYGGVHVEGQENGSEVTKEKLYELMKNMGNTISERLNAMRETFEAKTQKKD